MELEEDFWSYLDQLVAAHPVVLDRPRGASHPAFPELIYPLDYGYLDGTTTLDGGGIDVWLGSQPDRKLDAVALTVDLHKRDAELKLLLGCTSEEQRLILDFLNGEAMRALLAPRSPHDLLLRRQSVRRFQDRQVPLEVLDRLLEVVVWAPSAHNRQPWRFVVLTSREGKAALAQAMGGELARDLRDSGVSEAEISARTGRSLQRILGAPAAVLLCLDASTLDSYPDQRRQQAEALMGVQSVAMAGCYLLLAAQAEGLGGVWLCAPLFAPQAAWSALDLPENWSPQGLVLLGYPAAFPLKRERYPVAEVTIYR